MKKVKKPDRHPHPSSTSLASAKTESEVRKLKSQIPPPQITEPPKDPLPVTKDTSHAEISRSSAYICFEFVWWLVLIFALLWFSGLELNEILSALIAIAAAVLAGK